jgi:hypothetical protein
MTQDSKKATLKSIKNRNYLNKDCIYYNYLVFLNSYCIDHNSYKCKIIIQEILEKLGLSKNQHKKNLIKYIKWK